MTGRRHTPVRVLIADDHRLFAEALQAILSDRGADHGRRTSSRRVRGGRAGARTLRPDVVALDINMPVMDGFEAAAALEKLEPPPAVLILTGSSSPQDIDRARRAGVKGYVTKDSIAASLVEAILAAAG